MPNEAHQSNESADAQVLATNAAPGGGSEPAANGAAASPCSWSSRAWLFGALLVAGTFIAYLPALQGKLVWDDDSWTTNISGLLRDSSGLRTMWSGWSS